MGNVQTKPLCPLQAQKDVSALVQTAQRVFINEGVVQDDPLVASAALAQVLLLPAAQMMRLDD
jgi:hypothetical protein